MTTPVIPASQIIDLPGVGDRIGAAIAPLLEALRERREQEARQQQLMAQLGALKLQQDKFKDEQSQRAALKKGLEGQVEAIMADIEASNPEANPGPIQRRLADLAGAAASTNDPQAFFTGLTQMQRELGTARQMAVRKQYAQMARDRGTPLTDAERVQMHSDMLAAFPNDPQASAQVGMANALTPNVSSRTQDRAIIGRSIRELQKSHPELGQGQTINPTKFYRVTYDSQGNPLNVLGETLPSGTQRLLEVGDVDQRDAADFGQRYNNALSNIVTLAPLDKPEIWEEVERGLTLVEAAGTTPLGLDDMAQIGTRILQNAGLSEDAQIVINSFWDVLAARAQKGGGKVLPPFEWAMQVRTVAPLTGDKPNTRKAKITTLVRESEGLLQRGGPATEARRRAGLIVPFTWAPNAPGAGITPTSGTRAKINRTSGIGR